ncbi:hypothetical protein ABZ299_03760 [Streptomyces sp. NPDC006184]|uniref:hypothetical protein n=1 Tax=Streptomyces sp. NPDC006184 TaxID=3155455 RepID=UPI0033BB6646
MVGGPPSTEVRATGIMRAGTVVTPATWPDVVGSCIPYRARTAEVVGAYPLNGDSAGPEFGAVIGDSPTPARQRTRSGAAGRMPVCCHEFADPNALRPRTTEPPFRLGATHTTELPYLFDLGGRPRALTEPQRRLVDTMIDTGHASPARAVPTTAMARPVGHGPADRPCSGPHRPDPAGHGSPLRHPDQPPLRRAGH